MEQFDLLEGLKRKDLGRTAAASKHREDLEFARQVAREIAKSSPDGLCNADQVQKVMKEKGIDLGNAAGSIFGGSHWRWTGRWIVSSRETNNARMIRVWSLVGEERRDMGQTWEEREIAEHCGL